MGEAKLSTKNGKCTTVAVRYRFIFDHSKEPQLQFLPHEVQELEVEKPEEELNPETVEYDDDLEYLRSLDPKEWKSQDHYKVLGIQHLRFKATDEIIKVAHRKKVLKHHPDKRKALGEEIKPDDDYFTCITMAMETLGNNLKRRSYDSVDPEFDNSLPSTSALKKDFYKTFSYYFDLNSRWSERAKVPKLGGPNSSRVEVDNFYSFWYNFKSWREYSYEDEEDKDKCADRDERRYVDKLNKAERQRKKKEEMSRIRQLVDLAYQNDPRIAKFKQEDKDRKLAAKRAKQSAAQAKRDEEERLLREAALAKKQAEEEERAKLEIKRQEREVLKRALKKERKALRDTCKANNYFSSSAQQNLTHMTMVETLCEVLSLEELGELNENIQNNGEAAFMKAFKEHQERVERERQAVFDAAKQKSNGNKSETLVKVQPEWTQDNIQLLVKAVNLFPAGTNQRWEVVANFLNQHGTFSSNSSKFTAKLVLAKAKDLQNTDFSKNNLKEVANKQAFDNFKRDKRKNNIKQEDAGTQAYDNCNKDKQAFDEVSKGKKNNNSDESNISKKLDGITLNGKPETDSNIDNSDAKQPSKRSEPWTATEQELLEQALKTFPVTTARRWDRIAECLPNRDKKECMRRYKELVETVKAKKAAQSAASK